MTVAVRVLVVDDQRAVREGIARLLNSNASRPCRVFQAATPAEALQALHDHRPHVVMLDVDLAGEDGLAMLPKLLPHAQVMVVTSHGDAVTRERARRLGAHCFVAKSDPAAVMISYLAQMAG